MIQTIKKKTRKQGTLTLVYMLLLVTLVALAGCSSAKSPEPKEEEKSSNETVAETKVEEKAEVEDKKEVVTPESVAEPTAEPTHEPVVYEGIDMESTLPGAEWIESFYGIMEEPKVIVFSDETGRKEIIENGDRVYFNPDEDTIGIYLPEGAELSTTGKGLPYRETIYSSEHCVLYKMHPEKTRELKRQSAAVYIEYNGETIELPFDFMPQ